jgi:hypothetical protein
VLKRGYTSRKTINFKNSSLTSTTSYVVHVSRQSPLSFGFDLSYKRPNPPTGPPLIPPRPSPPRESTTGSPPVLPSRPPTRSVGAPRPRSFVRSDAIPRSSLRHLPPTRVRGGRQISTQRSIKFWNLPRQSPSAQNNLPVLASTFTVLLYHIRSTTHGSSHNFSRGTRGGRSGFAIESDTGRSERILVLGWCRSRSRGRGRRRRGGSYVDGCRTVTGGRSSRGGSRVQVLVLVLILVLVLRSGGSCESLLTVVDNLGLSLGFGHGRRGCRGNGRCNGDSLGLHLHLTISMCYCRLGK